MNNQIKDNNTNPIPTPELPKPRLTYKDLQEMSFYHAPNDDQKLRYTRISFACLEFLRVINETCPDSADKSAAIRQVREARMSANSSIANNGRF